MYNIQNNSIYQLFILLNKAHVQKKKIFAAQVLQIRIQVTLTTLLSSLKKRTGNIKLLNLFLMLT